MCAGRLGVAAGIVWGLGLFVTGAITVYTEQYAHRVVSLLGNIYPGYVPGSWSAAAKGLIWGFIDAFVAVWIISWIYNLLLYVGPNICRRSRGADDNTGPQE